MIIVGQEKPSLEDLSHFGVKGMQWGVRKKVTGAEIKGARRRLAKQSKAYRKERRMVDKTAKGSSARKLGEKKLEEMHRAYLKNPDRVTALRLTKGEKAVQLLFTPLTGIGIATSAAALGGSAIASRRVAYKQATGAYDKTKGRRKLGGFGSSNGAFIVSGANASGALLKKVGGIAMKSISAKAAANNSARLSNRTAIGSVANKLKYAKKSRKGVYKVSSI